MKHSLLGASGASRWLACPGSFHLSQRVKPAPPSIYAAAGSIAHELIEEAAAQDFTLDHVELFNTTRSCDGVDVLIDHDMLTAVEVMLDYARGRMTGSRLFKSEIRVYPPLPITPPVDVFGSLDLMVVDPVERWLEIIDYKHGAGVEVDVIDNAQLLFYAAGAHAALKQASPGLKIEKIILTVVQPRLPGQPPVKQWEISLLDLELWIADVLVPGIEKCVDINAPFNPGAHCRFCPGTASCPALLAKAQAAAKDEFSDGVGSLTLGEQLDLAETLQLWIDKTLAEGKARIEGGERVDGWRLVPTRATRKWTDEDGVVNLMKTLGLTPADIFTENLKTPAQMDKILVRKLGSNHLDKLMPFVTAVSSGTKLARTEQDNFDLLMGALDP